MRFPRLIPIASLHRRPALVPARLSRLLTAGFLAVALLVAACGKKGGAGGAGAAPGDKEALASVIAGFSGGALPADGPVKVTFVNPVADSAAVNRALEKNPFDISPSIKGTAVWVDVRTLEFRPEGRLERGREYQATLRLDHLMEVPEKLARF
ncbi:MAG TPA: Ig-like domain-containing protein, partial [Fibrobacteria bacterium]|nr:Ig-like domain-containing protein [Fibrobacteria bacterium]